MQLILQKFKKIDSKIYKVYTNGLKFCFILMLISSFILCLYQSFHEPYIFYIGISLAKSSLFFIVFFIICAIAIDTIKNDLSN